MDYVLSNAFVYFENEFSKANVFVHNGRIADISLTAPSGDAVVYNFDNCFVFPGLIDVHVHLREPGFSYKETVETGSMAAAHGGYTTVCAMPNLNPVPDSLENLTPQLGKIENGAKINVLPYGAVTKDEKGQELSDIMELAPYVCAFSDDGRGVQNEDMMRCAMKEIKRNGKILAAHCEDNSLLNGGYIHDGQYAKDHGHRGICSESEWGPIKRDIELVRETGCKYHVCHISAKESVELIRMAKKEGLPVSCETGPHYLTMNDSMLQEDGRFKMNPPIRSEEDRQALIEGLLDGTIDMIATDHAPHSAEEKSVGLEKSLMGVVGLETAFPVLYTELVKKNVISLQKLVELMSVNPRKRFNIGSPLAVGESADFTVYDLNAKYTVDPEKFLSMGRATPFAGKEVYGRCLMTAVKGEIVWKDI